MTSPLAQKTFKLELEFTVTMDELTPAHLGSRELSHHFPFLQRLQQALLEHEPDLIRHMLISVQNKLQEYADYLAAQGDIKPLMKVAQTLESDVRDFFEQPEAQFAQATRPIRLASMTTRLNHSTIHELNCCAEEGAPPRQVWADLRREGEVGFLMEKMGVAETREPVGGKSEKGHYLMVRYLTRQTDGIHFEARCTCGSTLEGIGEDESLALEQLWDSYKKHTEFTHLSRRIKIGLNKLFSRN